MPPRFQKMAPFALLALIVVFFVWQETKIWLNSPHHFQAQSLLIQMSAEERIANWTEWLARFTFMLVIVTAFLCVANAIQIRFLILADKTARTAADAASMTAAASKRSADALYKTEQALIIEKIAVVDASSLLHLPVFPKGSLIEDGRTLFIKRAIGFNNSGKTTTMILWYDISSVVSKSVPSFDSISGAQGGKSFIDYSVEPHGATEIHEFHCWMKLTDADEVNDGKAVLWCCGKVKYKDVFECETTRNFIWRLERPMVQFVPCNYDESRNWQSS